MRINDLMKVVPCIEERLRKADFHASSGVDDATVVNTFPVIPVRYPFRKRNRVKRSN